MIIEVLEIIKNAPNITEEFNWAVPRGRNNSLSLRKINHINDGVIMCSVRLWFTAIYDIEDINIVIPCTNLANKIITAKTSSAFSMTIELKLNSHILKDFVQLFSKTSNIFKKPSCPMVSNVFGFVFRCIALLIWLNIRKDTFYELLIFRVLLFNSIYPYS